MLRGRNLFALLTLAALPVPLTVCAEPHLPPNPFRDAGTLDATSDIIPPDPTAEYFDDGAVAVDRAGDQTAATHTPPFEAEIISPFDKYDLHFGAEDQGVAPGLFDDRGPPPPSYRPIIEWLHLRHSYTHGRHVGLGQPLVGSSWLNRPYYFGGDLGNLWMTRGVAEAVGRDVDAFGGIFLGADWDYYWGNELAFHWSTPELVNSRAPTANRADSLFLWSYSLMYYPWGDSKIRPYWRWGIGNTRVDFPLDDGTRHGEWLLTFPIGMGVKWPVQRRLAARAELTDQLACSSNGVPTLNNVTLTVGIEWRFGARPRSYWPWHPSRHIW